MSAATTTNAVDRPVVLLTGCSRGLGLSVLQQLLDGTTLIPQANVVAISRSLPQPLSSLLESHPDSVIHVQGSTTDDAVSQTAVDRAIAKWGRIDALILNAGIVDVARIQDLSTADFAHQLNVNTVSLIATIRAALPHLRNANGGGRVVFVSSGAAVGNTSGWSAYNASKAAMNSICRTMANEEKQIACFAVRPGVIDTEMQVQIRGAGTHMVPAEYERFVNMHKEGKLLPPHLPAHSLAALAVKGSRSHPKEKGSDKGIGELGGFVNWDAEELAGFKLDT
ncbi:uncharacterized protein PFL1_04423 [Pseudozyma flocculosa PF-1]|uniref:Related to dehydrogenase n=2 Tax=Pseudozyma flocculosa TaxID=84751 RepID=A0A5C3FBS3_9BASI|nr:uncharacterized protein PFL1_04423 [Pseudozyma flocculosa PF-1]EPQ28096.1 hypothetical protein PFL1_04423 [Pseudozyma flocculosa PF-1]SPO41894.1 related to dehydrogenase [Pseudozyma flocculosa]